MLIEIHMLQNHAPSNLNRDDTGSVKDCTFGGVTRQRISSQSLKRSIRKSAFFAETLSDKLAERTKFLPEEIKKMLLEKNVKPDLASAWAEKLTTIGKSDKNKPESEDKKPKKKEEDAKEAALLQTSQLMFYGKEEAKKIVELLAGKLEDGPAKIENKELIKSIRNAVGELKAKPVDIALFGRMTTMEAFEDVTAACQVAHAISVNRHAADFDYFTAVDDLSSDYREDAGSAHIGETEFSSSCFYKYFAIDFDAFVKSIGGDASLAQIALTTLVKAAALANPTGKQNSFAAHNPPHFVGVEIKNKKIPVNLANAFLKPIEARNKLSLIDEAIDALARYAKKNREAFSLPMKDQAHFIFSDEKNIGDEFSANKFAKLDDLFQWLEKHTGA